MLASGAGKGDIFTSLDFEEIANRTQTPVAAEAAALHNMLNGAPGSGR